MLLGHRGWSGLTAWLSAAWSGVWLRVRVRACLHPAGDKSFLLRGVGDISSTSFFGGWTR